ncbi:unnamed protein product [Notodromas monacha]|uniref:Exocyst complex component 2 n=1 Tax=Notodromas monacha TaxID=399045 RepID=A0A7R9BDD1_9CRUS|nr:unnamed protein product [Notodromas monacha]CAG0913248.1 unnamed protein product [Notodromas monacha]
MSVPVVTGISPKEGPPGTRITIRGENFGKKADDLIQLTVCGVDCTLFAEWKSPNKILARVGAGEGRGDIIVTTKQGGPGTCMVKFYGYLEAVGPLKESAVWIEERFQFSSPRRRMTASSMPGNIVPAAVAMQEVEDDDPLGLSDEPNEQGTKNSVADDNISSNK